MISPVVLSALARRARHDKAVFDIPVNIDRGRDCEAQGPSLSPVHHGIAATLHVSLTSLTRADVVLVLFHLLVGEGG